MTPSTPPPSPRMAHRRMFRLPTWRDLMDYVSPRALRSAWPWLVVRVRLLPVDARRLRGQTLAQRVMEQTTSTNHAHPEGEKKPARTQRFYLVRHGQSTFNVEGRLPSQLPNVPLTDEGRRQAHQAAVALAGLRLSAVISSPLERAKETAEIIARGWALPVQEEPRLMDTEMGRWAGRKISEVSKDDPGWHEFLKKPTEPPEGVESFEQVRSRTVAVIEALRADAAVGDDVVVVAHADVIKLIIAHYTGIPLDGARFVVVANASISALAFHDGHAPTLMAVNWTMAPHWLVAPAPPTPGAQSNVEGSQQTESGGIPATDEPETGAPSGVIM